MDDRQPVRGVEVLGDQLDPARREPLVLLVAAGAAAGEIGARRRPRARCRSAARWRGRRRRALRRARSRVVDARASSARRRIACSLYCGEPLARGRRPAPRPGAGRGARVVLPQRLDDLRAPVAPLVDQDVADRAADPGTLIGRGDPVRLTADQHLDAVRPAALGELDACRAARTCPRARACRRTRATGRSSAGGSRRRARRSHPDHALGAALDLARLDAAPAARGSRPCRYTARAGSVRLEHVQRHALAGRAGRTRGEQQLDRLAAVAAALIVALADADLQLRRAVLARSSAAGRSRSARLSRSAGCRRCARRRARGSPRTRRRGRRARPGGTARWDHQLAVVDPGEEAVGVLVAQRRRGGRAQALSSSR